MTLKGKMSALARQLPMRRVDPIERERRHTLRDFLSAGDSRRLLLIEADCKTALPDAPADSVDCVMTSPPYWGQREYSEEGIGLEDSAEDYISALLTVVSEIKRILKPEGSFWLNLGDRYVNKRMTGIPWRVAIAMMDAQGWILRNEVIWNKVKGSPDNTKDKLRNVHEQLFHFVKSPRYFYDVDAIRSNPKRTKVVNGAIVSASGVSGVRYKRQIELSTALTDAEKASAATALDSTLDEVRRGELADFRMIIRGRQRVTHSESAKVSGRAKELEKRGFYFLKYHPKGAKPGDVWDIIPEDSQNRGLHFSPYPLDLCKMPIAATCPAGGVVLDPFCGTGTTLLAAVLAGRRAVGIDISADYLEIAQRRCAEAI